MNFEEAMQEIERLKANADYVFCPYCQLSYLKGDDPYKSILAHVDNCLKHPIKRAEMAEDQITQLEKENRQLKAMFAANTPAEEIAVMRHELTTKREVLEKCVEAMKFVATSLKQNKDRISCAQSNPSRNPRCLGEYLEKALTLANEELKKGQS